MKKLTTGLGQCVNALFTGSITVVLLVIAITLGITMTITRLSDQLNEAHTTIDQQNENIFCLEQDLADQQVKIQTLTAVNQQLQEQLAALEEQHDVMIRMSIKLLGLVKLKEATFTHTVSGDVFNSVSEGQDVTSADWMGVSSRGFFFTVRFVVASKYG